MPGAPAFAATQPAASRRLTEGSYPVRADDPTVTRTTRMAVMTKARPTRSGRSSSVQPTTGERLSAAAQGRCHPSAPQTDLADALAPFVVIA